MRTYAILLITLVLLLSCSNTKKTIPETIKPPTEEEDNKLINEGYKKATIEDFSSESGCGFLIVLEEKEQVLQPLRPLTKEFNKKHLAIWVKYRPIRPTVPQCKKGQLIDLEDVKLR